MATEEPTSTLVEEPPVAPEAVQAPPAVAPGARSSSDVVRALAPPMPPPPAAAPLPAGSPTGPVPATPAEEEGETYGGLAQRLLPGWVEAGERADVLRRQKAEAQAPQLAALQASHKAFLDALGQSRSPRYLAPPLTTPPPSRQLRDFLDPIEGEPPEKSIGRLIQALGLFATGIGGMARGYVGAGLRAMTGALQGWQEGDAIRADRAFADWKENTDHAIKEWERERTAVETAMKHANMDLEQRFRLVELTGLMYDNKVLAETARAKDLEGIMKWLGERGDAEAKISVEMAKVIQSKLDRAQREDFQRQEHALKQEKLKLDQWQAQNTAAHQQVQDAQGWERVAAERERIKIAHADLAIKEKELAMGKPTPEGPLKTFTAIHWGKAQLQEIVRLTESKTVRLDHVMGGVRPFLNKKIQEERIGPLALNPQALAGFIGTLNKDEAKLVALVNDYVDSVIRVRTGAALPNTEYDKMAAFLPVLDLAPQHFKARVEQAQQAFNAQLSIQEQIVRGAGYRVPQVVVPSFKSGMEGYTIRKVN